MKPANRYSFMLTLLLISIFFTGCQAGVSTPTIKGPPNAISTELPINDPIIYPADADFIQIAWFYKPPPEEFYSLVSNKFDVFILTNHDEAEREQMRAAGLNAPIYQYLLLAEIQDPGSCTEMPNGDQVANLPGDFCRISSEHPEWFLLDKVGQRITNGSDYYYMDPAQEGFRAFWLERARQTQTNYKWDGLFLDNVEASLSKYQQKLISPMNYPDDASLQAAVEGFLAYLDQNYFTPENRPAIANIISTRDAQAFFRYLDYLDGAMLENFAVDWNSYYSAKEWEEQLLLISKIQSIKKSALLVAQGAKDDLQKQQFAFASYLLVTDGNTSFRYADGDDYRTPWWYANYEIDLGKPLGVYYSKDGIWMRDFEHGRVTVNPSDHTGEITVQP
jgi:hypothetical protein